MVKKPAPFSDGARRTGAGNEAKPKRDANLKKELATDKKYNAYYNNRRRVRDKERYAYRTALAKEAKEAPPMSAAEARRTRVEARSGVEAPGVAMATEASPFAVQAASGHASGPRRIEPQHLPGGTVNLLASNAADPAVAAARISHVRRITHLPTGMALIYLLLVRRADGTVPGYVGATEQPRQRLLAHRRKSSRRLEAALAADGLCKDDVLYVPLDVVPAADRDHYESLWTLRVAPHGTAGLNGFATIGNPASRRHFWAGGRGRGRG